MVAVMVMVRVRVRARVSIRIRGIVRAPLAPTSELGRVRSG